MTRRQRHRGGERNNHHGLDSHPDSSQAHHPLTVPMKTHGYSSGCSTAACQQQVNHKNAIQSQTCMNKRHGGAITVYSPPSSANSNGQQAGPPNTSLSHSQGTAQSSQATLANAKTQAYSDNMSGNGSHGGARRSRAHRSKARRSKARRSRARRSRARRSKAPKRTKGRRHRSRAHRSKAHRSKAHRRRTMRK